MGLKRLKFMLCITTSLPLGLAGAAFASQSDAAFAEQSEDAIVVTARRTEERLQDVPISITVFNQQQLTNRNVVTAVDLATYTPSLAADNRFGQNAATFAIRGFTQEFRTTPSVAVYFNDVVAPRGGSATFQSGDGAGPGSFFDLQNVQVLKGPQGTLFGRNTTGGAILLVPTKPTGKLEGYIEGSVGNYDMRRVQGVLNLPLADSLRLRLGFDRNSRDGYEKNVSGVGPSDFADIDYIAARLSLVADISSNLENYLVGSFSESDTNGQLMQVFACNPGGAGFAGLIGSQLCPAQLARQNAAGYYTVQNAMPDARSYSQQWQATNTTTWKPSDHLTVKNIISYARYKNIERQEVFGTNFAVPATFFGFPTGPLAGLPILAVNANPVPGSYINNQSTFTEELQFQGSTSDARFIWQAGLYYESSAPLAGPGNGVSSSLIYCQDANNKQCTDVLGILTGFPGFVGTLSQTNGSLNYKDVAIYGQGTFSISDTLKVTGGLRYTRDTVRGDSYATILHFPDPANPSLSVPSCLYSTSSVAQGCVRYSRTTSKAPTWVVDLEYSPDQNLLAYAKYARGYRQGSLNVNGAEGFDTFSPEKVDTYEVGLKKSFAGNMRGTLNIAAFYNNFANQQLIALFSSSTNSAPQSASIINAGKSRIYGVEVEGTLTPFAGFKLDASAAYLNSKLQSSSPVVLPGGSLYDTVAFTASVGGPLPYTPKFKTSITATYALPIPDAYGAVSFSTTYSHSSPYVTTVASPFGTIASTDLVNMNLNWTSIGGKPFDVSLFATNVFNRHYSTYVQGLYNVFGFESRTPGEPRMFGLRVRAHM